MLYNEHLLRGMCTHTHTHNLSDTQLSPNPMGNRADHVLNPPLPFLLQFSRNTQVVAHTDAQSAQVHRSGVVTENEGGHLGVKI